MLASGVVKRATGKQLGPHLVLGAVGVVGGIALFMTLLGAPARRADSCTEVAEFIAPRAAIVERTSNRHLSGINNATDWRRSADQLADVYYAFGRDLNNRKLLAPGDTTMRRYAGSIGSGAVAVGDKMIALDGSLARAEALDTATDDLRNHVARAREYCR